MAMAATTPAATRFAAALAVWWVWGPSSGEGSCRSTASWEGCPCGFKPPLGRERGPCLG
jgi:hypothetical protein